MKMIHFNFDQEEKISLRRIGVLRLLGAYFTTG